MEALGAVGSSIALVGIFKSCILAFEAIETANAIDSDIQKLALRLTIERCRLYTWGEAMGLTASGEAGQSRRIDECLFKDAATETLGTILGLFEDSGNLKTKYGCVESRDWTIPTGRAGRAQQDPVDSLVECLGYFGTTSNIDRPDVPLMHQRLRKKAKWTIRDKKKSERLITELKCFIDGVVEITKPIATTARQEGMLRYRIQKIENKDTLQLLSVVCENDYPDISDAASIKMEVLSLESSKRRDIEKWMAKEPGLSEDGNFTVSGPNPEGDGRENPENRLTLSIMQHLRRIGYHDTAQSLVTETAVHAYHENSATIVATENDTAGPEFENAVLKQLVHTVDGSSVAAEQTDGFISIKGKSSSSSQEPETHSRVVRTFGDSSSSPRLEDGGLFKAEKGISEPVADTETTSHAIEEMFEIGAENLLVPDEMAGLEEGGILDDPVPSLRSDAMDEDGEESDGTNGMGGYTMSTSLTSRAPYLVSPIPDLRDLRDTEPATVVGTSRLRTWDHLGSADYYPYVCTA